MNISDTEFKNLFAKYKKITVIGISPDASKPSQRIPLYMKSHGYDVVGVNPTVAGTSGNIAEIAGIPIYASLDAVPAEYRRFVNVFRRNDAIPEVVDEVLKVGGTEVLWLQLGITHADAEKTAEDAGLIVVSDRCWLVEHRALRSH